MSDNEDNQYKSYQEDSRIPCRYGAKCYQKNAIHHEKFKHPPVKDTKKQKGIKHTLIGKKRKKRDTNEALNDSPEKKVPRKDNDVENEYSTDENIPSDYTHDDNTKEYDKNNENTEELSNPSNVDYEEDASNQITIASLLKDCNINVENDKLLLSNAQTIIFHLFLTEMPEDFFQFYDFCTNICKEDPLNALKNLQLQLIGPYDVFRDKFLSSKINDKETLLRHWRYYYDPPEFQTVIKINGKDGLHFGYWRDDISQKPVFVAKNKVNVNCIIESVAENLFGAIDTYIDEKVKVAIPFEKTRIAQLHKKLKNYAKEKNITLDKKTDNMKAREKKVVARTFHKAGIVVPYNQKTELGYRELATTDHELWKLLQKIEQASSSETKKVSISKLEEIIRLATIAADECDFGTCLELGHDLFSSGVSSVQNKALNMLSLAYSLLQRPQLLKIAQTHLKNRKKDLYLSVLH